MLHFLLFTWILAVSPVIGGVKETGEILPAESGRFLTPDEINEAYDDIKKIKQNDDMQTDRRYYSQKYNHDDHGYAHQRKLHDDEEFHGPAILRSINSNNMHKSDPDIARQNKIILDSFSPDYHQPIWVLDYRYLKTGGRDYTRGPGGQILILPKNVHTGEHKEFRDYDSLLEHLRLKNMAEKTKHQRH